MIDLLAALFLGSADPETYSTKDYRSFPPVKLDRTVRRDLLSIFQPLDDIPTGNLIGLGNVTLTTKGFATEFSGVCARDWLAIRYAPVENAEDAPNGDVQPYAVDAERQYYFLKPPTKSTLDADDRRLPWSAECERAAKIEYEGWFYADSEFFAVRGYLALAAAMQVAKNNPAIITECDFSDVQYKSCVEQLHALARPQEFSSFGECEEQKGETGCYAIGAGGYEIQVGVRGGPGPTEPSDVLRVTVRGMIIIT